VSDGVDRFLEAARLLGHDIEVRRFPEGTHTAGDAARAIGCDLAQIVKSLVFVADERPVLALTSGVNRADTAKLRALTGAASLRRATADEVRSATGFPIGGTPPFNVGPHPLQTFVDETLLAFDVLWCGAGAPDAVFAITPEDLRTVTGGTVTDLRDG
jgi:prolyl-tRNA editing enzyme YbaK/EbsC (Cys-tRNA(Pro) deacylase)